MLDLALSAPDNCICTPFSSDADGLCVMGFIFAAEAEKEALNNMLNYALRISTKHIFQIAVAI